MYETACEIPSCHSSLAEWAEANPDERDENPPVATLTGGLIGTEAKTAFGSPPVQSNASTPIDMGAFFV